MAHVVFGTRGKSRTFQSASLRKVGLPADYSRSAPVIWSMVLFFLIIWYESRLIDELVVGSFEPPDARAACDCICIHFAYESYLLKVW